MARTFFTVVTALLFFMPVSHAFAFEGAGDIEQALRSGDAVRAERLATEALGQPSINHADRAHILMDRGLAREELTKFDLALADFTGALAGGLDKEDKVRALFDRGVTLDELGRTREAIADYGAAIVLAPGFAGALNNRANAWRRLGELDKAERDYRASLDAGNPQPEFPLDGLAQIAEARGDLPTARGLYRQSLSANGRDGLAAKRLAALVPKPGELDDENPPVQLAAANSAPNVHVIKLFRAASTAPRQTHDNTLAAGPRAGTAMVQLGAFRDEHAAAAAWNRLSTAGDGRLATPPRIIAADVLGKGHFYRLRLGPYPFDQAIGLCAHLRAKGNACFVVAGT